MANILDEKDLKILEVLKKDSSLSTQKIAKKTLIPITTVHNRIKKLEKEKIIIRYTVDMDRKKLGKNIFAHILVNVDNRYLKNKNMTQEDLSKKIKKYDIVDGVSIVTGTSDIMVKISVKDIDELNAFLMKNLRDIEGVEKTTTMIVLKEI